MESDQWPEALERFSGLHPVDQGEVLDGLPREFRQSLLAELDHAVVAGILEYLEPEESAEMVGGRDPADLAQILDLTDPDVAVDILQQIPEEKQQETLEAMADAAEVTELLQYQDDTAGGLMITDYPVVTETTTIPNALDQLRLLGSDAEDINSVLVANDQQSLVGSLSVTRLVLAEDLMDVVTEEATEDMFRIASVGGERIAGPMSNSLRRRLPWLYINLATAFLAAVMVSLFEDTISRVVALAVFLPVVASQGGIGGTQTATLVVRSMALGEVPRRLGLRLLARELALGLIHGVALGVVVGFVAYLWKGNFTLGVVLGLAILGNMLVAGMFGAGVPLLLRQLRMDPAVSSAVFVTTFTDVIGFVLFLGLAAVFVDHLV